MFRTVRPPVRRAPRRLSRRTLGVRLGWVLAVTMVSVGTAAAFSPASPSVAPKLAARAAAVGAAATNMPILVDRYLGGVGSAPTAGVNGPALALADDAFDWPAVAPKVVTTVVKPAAPKAPAIWWSIYHGTNHVWMPTLGINRTVYSFPCSRGTSPDNLVYRWGCAGTNNVYLLGHAYGVFKPLHDAYYNGRLKVGMPVVYADSRGRVHLFRVTSWRIVNAADAAWAIASQPRLSMTLQTCVGTNGDLRLNVRLVAVNN